MEYGSLSVRTEAGFLLYGMKARIWLYERDGASCRYCRRKLNRPRRGEDVNHDLTATADHIVALSHGGRNDDPGNLVLCCLRCNQWRSNEPFESYARFWDNIAGPFEWVPGHYRRRYDLVTGADPRLKRLSVARPWQDHRD